MSRMISDMLAEKVPTDVGNAVCNAGGKLLKVVELQFKYGNADEQGKKDIHLALEDRTTRKAMDKVVEMRRLVAKRPR